MKIRRKFTSFFCHTYGNTSVVLAISMGLVATLAFFTIDYSRATYYRNVTQHALDAAILSGVVSPAGETDAQKLASVRATTQRVFDANSASVSPFINYQPVVVVDNGDGSYTATVNASINTMFNFNREQGQLQNHRLAATALSPEIDIPTEVAIALDTSLNIDAALGDAKAALSHFMDALYGTEDEVEDLYISVIPFSDAVKIDPRETSNGWLTHQFTDLNIFSGCMTNRVNATANQFNDAAPLTTDSLFPRYSGPFEHGGPARSYGIMHGGETHEILIPTDIQAPLTDGLIVQVGSRSVLTGRQDFAIDYIHETNLPGLGLYSGSERLVLDLGAEYRSYASFLEVSHLRYGGGGENEEGVFEAFDNAGNLVAGPIRYRGDSDGGNSRIDVSLSTIAAPVRRLEYSAVDDGQRGPNSDWRDCDDKVWWGRDAAGVCIFDNTDYIARFFRVFTTCEAPASLVIESDRSIVEDTISALTTDGPTRTDRGMAWAYYALSPNWRGVMPGSTSSLPRDYSDENRKIAILVTQGGNIGGTLDDDNTIAICDDMKGQGIDIYTISFDAPVATQSMLQSCASDADKFFNAPSASQLQSAFDDIGREIRGKAKLIR